MKRARESIKLLRLLSSDGGARFCDLPELLDKRECAVQGLLHKLMRAGMIRRIVVNDYRSDSYITTGKGRRYLRGEIRTIEGEIMPAKSRLINTRKYKEVRAVVDTPRSAVQVAESMGYDVSISRERARVQGYFQKHADSGLVEACGFLAGNRGRDAYLYRATAWGIRFLAECDEFAERGKMR